MMQRTSMTFRWINNFRKFVKKIGQKPGPSIFCIWYLCHEVIRVKESDLGTARKISTARQSVAGGRIASSLAVQRLTCIPKFDETLEILSTLSFLQQRHNTVCVCACQWRFWNQSNASEPLSATNWSSLLFSAVSKIHFRGLVDIFHRNHYSMLTNSENEAH